MENLTHVFNIFCIVFLLWMSFRWTTKTFADSMVKVATFLMCLLGCLLEAKLFELI